MFTPGRRRRRARDPGPHRDVASRTRPRRSPRWQRAFDWMSRPSLVSIAAVQGHAIGAGFQLALGRRHPHPRRRRAAWSWPSRSSGIVPDLGGTKRLVDLVGYSRAAEICLTGRPVLAEEALRIGLASHVVARDELDDAVERTVAAVLAVDRDAATETKALLLGAARRTQDEQEHAEREAQYRRLRALVGHGRVSADPTELCRTELPTGGTALRPTGGIARRDACTRTPGGRCRAARTTTTRKVPKGTWRRIAALRRPYRRRDPGLPGARGRRLAHRRGDAGARRPGRQRHHQSRGAARRRLDRGRHRRSSPLSTPGCPSPSAGTPRGSARA